MVVNKLQKLILIIGAIVLIVVVWMPPKTLVFGEGYRTDAAGAFLRAISVLFATAVAFLVAQRRKKE